MVAVIDKSLGSLLNHDHSPELDDRYVNVTGDTMTGALTINYAAGTGLNITASQSINTPAIYLNQGMLFITGTSTATNTVAGPLVISSFTADSGGITGTAYGMYIAGTVYPHGSGSNFAYGWHHQLTVKADAGLTIANAYGINIQALAKSGSGDITTVAGLAISAQTIGDTNYALWLSDTGATPAGGITFGTDTNLYRIEASVLASDDSARLAGYLRVGSTSAPTNTTAGDLTAIRLFVGSAQNQFTVATTGATVITTANASNAVPLTLTQNDATNDQKVLVITSAANAGTNNAIDLTTLNGYAAKFDGGDLYIKLGPISPYAPNGGGIVIEPYNGTTGGGSDDLSYARILFNPEKATLSGSDQADVVLSAHKYHATGALHEHFSVYTTNAAGTPLKRLDLDYLQDTAYWIFQNSSIEIDNDTTDYSLHIHQDGTLDNDKQAVFINWATDNANTNAAGVYIYSNYAHTGSNSENALLRVRNDNASSVATVLRLNQDGSGDYIRAGSVFQVVSTGSILNSGYARIGSLTAPANTTAGDLTLVRLNIGNSAFTNTGRTIFVSGTSTATANQAEIFAGFFHTLSPASNSASEFRALTFRNTYSASAGVTFTNTGGGTAGMFENRIGGSQDGTITKVSAISPVALNLDSGSTATATITNLSGVSLTILGRPSGTSVLSSTTIIGYDASLTSGANIVTATTTTFFKASNPGANAITTLVGIDIASLTRGNTTSIGAQIAFPGIGTGQTVEIGATTDAIAIKVPTASIGMGNQTNTTTNAMGVYIGIPTYTSTTNTRTITNAAGLYIAGAPVASTNVTFGAGAVSTTAGYSIWVDGGETRLDGKLSIGGVTAASNDLSLEGNSARVVASERHSTANTAGNSLTIKSGGATSGATDKAAGDLILATGLSTGTGASKIKLQTATVATTGTSDNTLVDRVLVLSPKSIADNVDTSLVSCTIASGSSIGGMIDYVIEVTDGTDYQVETGRVYFSAVNKGGTVTRTINEVDSQQSLSSGATLTTTWAISAASPAVISLTADTSLASPSTGYPRVTMIIYNLSQQAITVS